MKQKIFDLTRGKYPSIYDNTYIGNEEVARRRMFFDEEYDTESLLSNVPVFLVESSMANEYINVPGCECIIRVPSDKTISVANGDFDIDEWVNSKEGSCDKPIKERIGRSMSIVDLLGVYVYSDTNELIPRRIFIWVDKIMEYAENNTNKINYSKQQVECNAKELFYLVLYHELAHALMDVGLYGKVPAPNFSYSEDYPYRFIEEAYANAIALEALLSQKTTLLTSSEKIAQQFVIDFVKSQGAGYREGWDIYEERHSLDGLIIQWMYVKILFNYDIACLLREFWEYKSFNDINYFKSVGRKGLIAMEREYAEWLLMKVSISQPVSNKVYRAIDLFNEYGLCKVMVDETCLYGYIDEQGHEIIQFVYQCLCDFDKGKTFAIKDGKCGAIDIEGNVLIPFELPYVEVRNFINGRASVKDTSDKWGVINSDGELVVPCEKNSDDLDVKFKTYKRKKVIFNNILKFSGSDGNAYYLKERDDKHLCFVRVNDVKKEYWTNVQADGLTNNEICTIKELNVCLSAIQFEIGEDIRNLSQNVKDALKKI